MIINRIIAGYEYMSASRAKDKVVADANAGRRRESIAILYLSATPSRCASAFRWYFVREADRKCLEVFSGKAFKSTFKETFFFTHFQKSKQSTIIEKREDILLHKQKKRTVTGINKWPEYQ